MHGGWGPHFGGAGSGTQCGRLRGVPTPLHDALHESTSAQLGTQTSRQSASERHPVAALPRGPGAARAEPSVAVGAGAGGEAEAGAGEAEAGAGAGGGGGEADGAPGFRTAVEALGAATGASGRGADGFDPAHAASVSRAVPSAARGRRAARISIRGA